MGQVREAARAAPRRDLRGGPAKWSAFIVAVTASYNNGMLEVRILFHEKIKVEVKKRYPLSSVKGNALGGTVWGSALTYPSSGPDGPSERVQ